MHLAPSPALTVETGPETRHASLIAIVLFLITQSCMFTLLLESSVPLVAAIDGFGVVVIAIIILGGICAEHFPGGLRGASTIRLGNKKKELGRMDQALQSIQEADPKFDLKNFCVAATNAFLEVEKAFDSGNLSDIRSFVSDGIYQRMAFRLEEEKSLGRSRKTIKLQVRNLTPVEVTSSKNNLNAFEVISMRITGLAVRQYRLKQDGTDVIIEEPEPIAEVWTFLRRRGAQTTSNDFGSVHGNCPNCGTDLSVNQWEKCPSCESTVRSGEHDWVLSEISDQSSWKVTKPFKMSSATRYWIKQDQGFSSHYLEDRASVIFFRKFLADRLGVIDPLGKVATDRFCAGYEKKLTPDDFGKRVVYLHPRILAADVSGVITEDPFDKALMHIRWSARRGTIDRRGELELDKDPVQISTMMVLVRKHGTKTRIERTITSSHCPKCGAPESNNASHACEFCHTVLNDGVLEWTLADVLPFTSTPAMALRKKAYEGIETNVAVMTVDHAEDAPLTRVVMMEQKLPEFTKSEMEGVQIDGLAPNVTVREDDITLCQLLGEVAGGLRISKADAKDFIREVAKKCGIDNATLVQAMRQRQKLDTRRLKDLNSQVIKRWLMAMINVSLIDSRMQAWEKVYIIAAAKELGLSRYDVEAAIRTRTLQLEEWTEGMRSIDMFSWVVYMAAADGRFDPKEIEQLKELATHYGISNKRLKEMCLAAKENKLEVSIPEDPNIGQLWLVKMIDMAFADGNVCSKEKKVLAKVAKKIGLTDYDLQQLIRRRRAVLYKKAQEVLREKPPVDDDELHLKTDWSD
ncbi:TIM44-like domain-containing protein [Bremerella alba]|uniref:DnaJ-like protein DjlA n=1 Tax=Bremerella alba TaxID=980252 RepID=A0A7V8V764_9BACT|nr:TIM44-like domain-containing protein [Bremerella alba]MBA2115961.1 DnaJ-like protein DjlA [Bremerella alba]